MAEYSYPLVQTVEAEQNILFLNGGRCCRKGYIMHSDASGVFRFKGVSSCKTIYKVHFNANVAASAATDGGVLAPLSVALVQNGEVLRNVVATVTPTALEAFNNISFESFIELPCGCCDTISIKNISENDTSIDVINANIIIERVA